MCPKCGGALKPEIIFFGDSVPKPMVNFVFKEVEKCDAVFVVGSSLEVRVQANIYSLSDFCFYMYIVHVYKHKKMTFIYP